MLDRDRIAVVDKTGLYHLQSLHAFYGSNGLQFAYYHAAMMIRESLYIRFHAYQTLVLRTY